MSKLGLVGLTAKMEMTQVIKDDLAIEMKRIKGRWGNTSPNSGSKGGSTGSTESVASNMGGPNSGFNLYSSSGYSTCTITISPHRSSTTSSTSITPARTTIGKFASVLAPYRRLMDNKYRVRRRREFVSNATTNLVHVIVALSAN